MKKTICKKVGICFAIIFMLVFLVFTKSSADDYNLGSLSELLAHINMRNTIYLARDDSQTSNATAYMAGSDYIYCFQHSKSFYYDKYKVIGYMKIEGHRAEGYKEDDTPVTKDSKANIALGYILSEGNYYKGYSAYGQHTIRQRALWHYGNTWMDNVGNDFGLSWTVEDGSKSTDSYKENGKSWESLKEEASKYASEGFYSNPKVTFNNSTVTTYDNTINGAILGPFNVNFNDYDENNRIHIKSIEVKGVNNTTIPSGSISFYSDAGGRNSISVDSIKQNTNFYIKNNSNLDVKGITVNLETDLIYKAYVWFLTNTYENTEEECQKVLIADVQKSYTNTASGTLNITSTGSLYIHKADLETGNTLEGAGFKIYRQNSGWLKGTQPPYEIVSNVNDATEYTMDNNNKTDFVKYMLYDKQLAAYQNKMILKIDGLRKGNYYVYETKAPNGGYELRVQNGYNANTGYVETGLAGKVGEKQSDNSVIWNRLVDIKNAQKIYISGRVWEEGIPEKGSYKDYDSLYNSNIDHNLGGIIVKLIKKDSDTIISTVTTNSDGTYLFDKLITRSDLKDYYIQFDYSSKITGNIKYIPVAFNKDKINGSKALVNTIPTKDEDIKKGIAQTYKGKTDNLIATYGLENVGNYNSTKLTLECINLGIKPLLDPDYVIRENLAYLKLNIKGYTYTYSYGGTGNTDKFVENGLTARWQNSNSKYGYSREIYPSDIIYDRDSSKQELEATVVYRIDVTNPIKDNIKELYQQPDALYLTSVENQYDTKRYTLIENEIWDKGEKSGTAVMKKAAIDKMNNKTTGIGSTETSTEYIQFRVNRAAITEILKNPRGIIEEFPTTVKTNAYHKYHRDNYMWSNLSKTGNNINGVKSTSDEHQTRVRSKETQAPYLVFSIDKQRTISGKVFKDNIVTNNGEKLGNGKYDSDEKGVEGVKVELLDIGGEKLTLSHLYQGVVKDNKTETETKDAVVTTNSVGEYSLEGVVPGRYYLRFTYGNGNYKITRLNGEVVEEGKSLSTKIEGKEITAKEYKSTIINETIREKIKNIISFVENRAGMTEKQKQEYETKLNEEIYTWYKDEMFKKDEKYSIGVDDITVRKEINESQENVNAQALSPQISITIENTNKNSAQETEQKNDNTNTKAKDVSGKESDVNILNEQKEDERNKFEGFYFGIIEQPKQEAEIEKIITNVKLTNSQGNVLYNGNPENISTQGTVAVADLDNKKNGGSTYVRAEVMEESLYGSNLEITYEVRISNISDINYYNEEYYKYGEKEQNKEVTLTPNDVRDYLDKTLEYNAEKSDKTRITEVVSSQRKEKDKAVPEFKLIGWKALYTNKNKEREEEKTEDKVVLVASRKLSKDDEDMEITSRAEIIEINHTPDPSDTETSEQEKTEQIKVAPKEVHTNGMVKATLTITPPTGKTTNTSVNAIAGIISLIVLLAGIVLLKKKIE